MANDEGSVGAAAALPPRPGPRSRKPRDRRQRRGPALGRAHASVDRRLVRTCLQGGESAWHALVDRYQALVYSLILRHGQAAAGDPDSLFVAVWREIFNRLGERESRADFCRWLVSLTLAVCGMSPGQLDERSLERLLEEQRLRCCLAELSPPCAEVLRYTLAAGSARSDQQAARRLGIPAADWPAIRQVCLARLERLLREHGYL